jgi:hypothetical protein
MTNAIGRLPAQLRETLGWLKPRENLQEPVRWCSSCFPLPRRVGNAEIDVESGVDREGCVLCHFASFVSRVTL